MNKLSPREIEFLSLCANDYTQVQIAARLNLSHQTVKNTIHTARRKFKVRTTAGAVYLAAKHNLI